MTTDAKDSSGSGAADVCGIVMPISPIDGCSEAHWIDVKQILTEGIEAAGFKANLVSSSDDSGIIQKRIVQNLYENPVVVCDVSGKNPNVMFELGMRLAFDKPTIIVKDDKTTYSFDTGVIEHVEYPRDLRFGKIVEFKRVLEQKIKSTYSKSKNNAEYTTFLKHFGEFKVAKLDKKEVTGQEYIIDELRALKNIVENLSLSKVLRNVDDSFVQGNEGVSRDLLSMPIGRLQISDRVKNMLHVGGVRYVGDIVELGEMGLLAIPSVGRRTLNEIKEALVRLGIRLGMGG